MKKQTLITMVPMVFLLALISVKVHAQWNGIGVSTGTGGSNICDTVNWSGDTINGNFTTIDTAGAYTLTMSTDVNLSSVGMDFSCPVDGVQLTIVSDSEDTPRTLTSGGLLRFGKLTSASANTVTFSKDIHFNVVSTWTIARSGELMTGAPLVPVCTINGPVAFGSGTGIRHTGGSLIMNGCVSGTGYLSIGGNTGASVYTTLTCPTNTFSGGIRGEATQIAYLTATASTVIANQGQPSALGSGGPICFPANSSTANYGITLSGFSTPQTTDRVFVLTSTFSYLFNNGTAPLRLTGAITNNAAVSTSYLYLRGTYNSHTSPNVISGPIIQQSPSNVIVPRIGGNGIWRLTNPASTFTGAITVGNENLPNEGLQFTSANTLGLNSTLFLGNPLNDANNYFTFLGDADCTINKGFAIDGYYHMAVNNLIANGDGKLTLSGPFFLTTLYNSTSASRGLAFGGTGEGLFTGMTWLTNRFAIKSSILRTYSVDIRKHGTGSWRFAGEHLDHEGNTVVEAGNMILDYTDHDQLTSPTNTILLNEGKLTFRGAPSGVTEESINTLALSERSFQFNTLELDANGGNGVHLYLDTLEARGLTAQLTHLFDLSSAVGNTLAATNLSGEIAVVNGLLMRNSRAVILIKRPDGVSLPTWDNADKHIVPFTAYDAYPGTTTDNYLFTSDITRSSDLAFSTITADSSANDVTVDIGTGSFISEKGRAILARGAHDITFRATSEEGASITWFHNYLTDTAALNLDLSLPDSSSGPFFFTGPGLTITTKEGLGSQPNRFEGILRVTRAQTLALTLYLRLTDGAVLEIGADLNDAAPGDFSLACGASSNGIFLNNGAGFSAYGTDRTVNLGGTGATLTWGANGFLNNVANEDHGFALKLSSPHANAMVDFCNPIALSANNSPYGFRRTVEVADGSAAIDALLSGALFGDSELVKTGTGTLKVSAAQTYNALLVKAGGFIAADGCFAASNVIPVTLTSATLGGTAGSGNVFGTLALAGDCVLDAADGTAAMSFADCSQTVWSNATLTIRGELADNTLRFGTSGTGLTSAQLASITVPGATVRLMTDGYIRVIPKGILIRIL